MVVVQLIKTTIMDLRETKELIQEQVERQVN